MVRAAVVASPPYARPQGLRVSRVFFEYTGRTGLTVTGPATGRRYRFERPGARVEVDLKDRASLTGVPHLRQVVPG